MQDGQKSAWALSTLVVVFAGLTIAFLVDLLGHPEPLAEIPLVDRSFLSMATNRKSYADLMREDGDVFNFDCYLCHDEDEPPTLRYDADHNLIIPEEHSDITMAHGTHGRNNDCLNCHNENNLLALQPRDGRQLDLENSTPLCGSCHGPTYRDWDAGVHGRINGYWNTRAGPATKQICVSCHDPHGPHPPSRNPAPGPHPLRAANPVLTRAEPTH